MIEILRDNIPIQWIPFEDRTYLVGRHPCSDILLDSEGIAPQQARIIKEEGRTLLFNLGRPEDLMVNDRQVRSTLLETTDIVRIRNYQIRFREGGTGTITDLGVLKSMIHQALVERLDLLKFQIEKLGDRELWQRCDTIIANIIQRMQLPPDINLDKLRADILNEALGLGPLEELLADEEITEIMVNGKDRIFVERHGRLQRQPSSFTSDEQVINIISRIVNPLGRRIDESAPMVDARLKDGSRVNAIIPPLSCTGPTITIRKFSKKMLTADDLVGFGSLTCELASFLRQCVLLRRNMVISGGTGSGKTTLLNVLSSFIPAGERVVTIEDSAELRLPHENLVSLEARPPNIEGKGEITIRDLVRNALRMRPDRIIVGECRSGEAIDMLQAMNTGHDGSLTTIHANNTQDAILRLETMVMMAGFDLPVAVIRRQIASAIHLIVQQSRLQDGARRVVCVSEINDIVDGKVNVVDLFVFRQRGLGADGRIAGEFVATGAVPSFLAHAAEMGLAIDGGIFEKDRPLQ